MKKKSKVLALKYRPENFKEVIGQEVVVQTIYNSIKTNKIPNAYLFTGIRGTGKTTLARLVAKSLNCINGIDKICEENYCEHCQSISYSNNLDVLEMDAASKTGVDDVRDLIEFSRYPPNSAKYKIFIIDEVHMLSKQAFNALLKTLEEPPEYLKFIFCTTEIKKIPITVVSRTQRFDLSRVNSEILFKFIQEIKTKENGKVSDDALRLIVKISEGSVRDALSLLDRGLISSSNDEELNLKNAQKIFGYFDKGFLIELFEKIFEGNEKEVIRIYKTIYNTGVEPKTFLNDFLEILYYIKNIQSLKTDGSNFTLNDSEFRKIETMSKNISPEITLLFWQFTIKFLDELNIVSNQELSLEMFLIRILYLNRISEEKENKEIDKNYKNQSETLIKNKITKSQETNNKQSLDEANFKNKTISQIKNFSQKHYIEDKSEINEIESFTNINSFDQLIDICNEKKEVKLKYELENNVKLVSFENTKIEISFNENLDVNFVKDLSSKLYEWTKKRWVITFSKEVGNPTKKQMAELQEKKIFDEVKKKEIYKKIRETFPDIEIIKVNKEK